MTARMIPAERRARIVSTLTTRQAVQVCALSAELGVSPMTVRRDLAVLERDGVLDRSYGGGVPRRPPSRESSRAPACLAHAAEKERVAKAAAAMVGPGDTVFLGSGTTVARVPRHVDPDLGVRFVTHSLAAAAGAQAASLEVIFLGGLYRASLDAVEGSWPLEMISHFWADKAFLGVDGLDLESGLTTPSVATTSTAVAGVEMAMVSRTRGEVVVLADHSKIGLVGDLVVCLLDQLDLVIVDDGVEAGVREQIRRAGPRCEAV